MNQFFICFLSIWNFYSHLLKFNHHPSKRYCNQTWQDYCRRPPKITYNHSNHYNDKYHQKGIIVIDLYEFLIVRICFYEISFQEDSGYCNCQIFRSIPTDLKTISALWSPSAKSAVVPAVTATAPAVTPSWGCK